MEPVDACTLPDTNSTLQQLGVVISKSDSVLQVDRQIILLETFLAQTRDTVDIADLGLLSNVMMFLTEREEFNEAYNKYLCRIINILKHPPAMKNTSDQLKYKEYLVQHFSTMGFILLQSRDEELKSQILEIIQSVIKSPRSKFYNSVPTKACVHAMELSDLMDCMADFLAISNTNLYHLTVNATLQICKQSTFCSWTLLMKNSIDTLLLRTITIPKENRIKDLDTSFQLLWTLFRCTSNYEDWSKVSPPSTTALRCLRLVLKESSMEQFHNDYITNLNNIAAVILKLMHLFPSADYIISGLIEDIAHFATMTEIDIESTLQSTFKTLQKNFQFKKLMLACLSLSPISPLTIEMFEQHKIAHCLVKMISIGNISMLEVEQTMELLHYALLVICALFECLQKHFIDAGVVSKLLTILEEHYIDSDQPIEETAHLVIETLFSLCCSKRITENTRETLQDKGTVTVLLKVCELNLKSGSCLTIRSQSTLYKCLIVLATLMENRTNLITHAESSLFIVSTLYQKILKPCQNDSLIDNRLTVAATNYAWKCLVGNKETIYNFIISGGVYLHIDILERSLFSTQLVLLTVLCDICEYPQSLKYLFTWRGHSGVTLLSVLCRIWRVEEERFEVSRSEHGCILNVEQPLMGKEQFIFSTEEKNKIVSIFDVFGSTRPKIFAIVQLLDRHEADTKTWDERFGLGYDRLPWEDKVTMKLVEAYLPLKLGEIWWEISKKQETVMPLDRYLAQTLADRYLQWTRSVQRAQQQLVAGAQKEANLCVMGQRARLTSALEALHEVVSIAHSVDRQLRLRNWRRLQETIQASRPPWACKDLKPSDYNVILMLNEHADIVLQNDLDVCNGINIS